MIVARDKANLKQGMHAMVHELATIVREIDQNYALYGGFKKSRIAAKYNLDRQNTDYYRGRSIYLNVLLAINDWGNAVNNEASSLIQYNIALAELERSTGTILESHGIRFVEERFGAIGPLGRWSEPLFYPYSTPPTENGAKHPDTGVEAELQFNLKEIEIFQLPSTRKNR